MNKRTSALVVDDDEGTRALVRNLLEDAGYTVQTAGCGRSASTRLRRCAFDLLVLDYHLPDMNAERLMSVLMTLSERPIVLVTSGDSGTEVLAWVARESLPFLPKPFSTGRFVRTVKRILARRARVKIGD